MHLKEKCCNDSSKEDLNSDPLKRNFTFKQKLFSGNKIIRQMLNNWKRYAGILYQEHKCIHGFILFFK